MVAVVALAGAAHVQAQGGGAVASISLDPNGLFRYEPVSGAVNDVSAEISGATLLVRDPGGLAIDDDSCGAPGTTTTAAACPIPADGTRVKALVRLGDGDDRYTGGLGGGRVDGDAGNDALVGSGVEALHGGAGDDTLALTGALPPAAHIVAYEGYANGDAGNDRITGGPFLDRLQGGEGADTMDAVGGNRDEVICEGADKVRLDWVDWWSTPDDEGCAGISRVDTAPAAAVSPTLVSSAKVTAKGTRRRPKLALTIGCPAGSAGCTASAVLYLARGAKAARALQWFFLYDRKLAAGAQHSLTSGGFEGTREKGDVNYFAEAMRPRKPVKATLALVNRDDQGRYRTRLVAMTITPPRR
jgi:hypothetical protein